MSEGLPFKSWRRSRPFILPLLAALVLGGCPQQVGAQTPKFNSFETRFASGAFDETITWTVAGVSNVEQFMLLPPAANYRGDPPPFGKGIWLTADLIVNDTTPVAGTCAEYELHTLTLYGYNLDYIDHDTFTCKPGQPCPSDGASEHLTVAGDFTFWPTASGATLSAIDYMVVGGCRPQRRAVITLVPAWDTAFWRSDPQQNGGPDAKPFVIFTSGDDTPCEAGIDRPDGSGCPGSGAEPPTPEDCAEGGCRACPAGMQCDPGDFGQCPAVTINGCPGPSGPNACGGGSFGRPQGLPGYWVDTSLVMPVIKDTDYVLVGTGPPIRMTRTWTPIDSGAPMFGPHWSFSYDGWLEGGFCAPAVVWTGRGGGRTFTPPAGVTCDDPPVGQPLSYVPSAGNLDALTYTRDTPITEHFEFRESQTGYLYRYDYATGGGFRLSRVTNRAGDAVTIARNPDATIASVTDASGNHTSFGYDTAKRCTSMTTADGLAATYAYDAQGRLSSATDLLGTVSTYSYDAAGDVVGFAAGGRNVTFLYGTSSGRRFLAGISHDGSHWTTIAPPSSGGGQQSLLVTSPTGRARQFTARDGNTIAMADVVGTTSFEYDLHRRPVKITRPDATFVTYQYDGAGNLEAFMDAAGRRTTYTHDASRRMLTRTNAASGRWEYGWDLHDALTSVRSPAGRVTLYGRDARGRITSATQAGRGLAFTYDAAGNVATIASPTGQQSRFRYDERGNLIAYADPLGAERRYVYDANRRLTTLIEPDGTSRRLAYDACASTGATDANGHASTTSVNSSLYATAVTDASGRALTQEYDHDNRVIRRTVAGVTTLFGYDAAGRLASESEGGGTVRFGLDATGRTTGVTDARSHSTHFTYDATGLWLTRTDPNGHVRSVTRDALGRVVTSTNARGQTVGFTYDADGRLTARAIGATPVATIARDPVSGQPTSVSDPTGTTTYAYDAAAQLTRIERPGGVGLDVAYNAVGQITRFTYSGGFTVSRTYDGNGRLARVEWPGGFIRLVYDAAGNLLVEQRSNATETRHTLDAGGALVRLEHVAGGTAFARFVLTRDAAGRIAEETRAVPEAPATGGMASASAAFGNDNELTSTTGTAYTYDEDGNLTGITGSRSWNATFDVDGRLTSLHRGAETRTYTYDGVGARVGVMVDGVVRREFRSPSGRLLWEADAGGQIRSYYVYAGNRLVARVLADGSTLFYHHDVRGSTVAMSDGSGTVVNAYSYGPFGEVIRRREAVADRFTYAGQHGVEEEGDGLYFMRFRYYDARDGRFITRDPIDFAGGYNLYGYVGGDVPNSIDPSGLAPPRGDARQNALKCLVVVGNGAEAMLTLAAGATVGGPIGVVAAILAVDDLITAFRYAGGRSPKAYESASDVLDDLALPGGDGRQAVVTWIYHLFVPRPLDFGGDGGLLRTPPRQVPEWMREDFD